MFRTNTVDSLVADISKKVTKLLDLSTAKCAEVDAIQAQRAALADKAAAAQFEANRAARLANRFNELIA